MSLDAIIIADTGADSFSGTHPLKLTIDGHVADVQTIRNYIANHGQVRPPVAGADRMNWAAAPKLNGIYLQSYLSRSGLNVALIDSYYDQHRTFSDLLQQSPRAILISTTFIIDKSTLTKLAADIRVLAPDVRIIVGGPFVFISHCILQRAAEKGYLPDTAQKSDHLFLAVDDEPAVDLYIIDSQGEAIARDALNRLRTGTDFQDLPNTAVLIDGGYRFSRTIDDSTAAPAPIVWQRLDAQTFASGVIPLQASTGCPYHCAFCNFVKDPKMTRVKPIDEIIAEMRQVSALGAKYIWFVDDNFRLGRNDLDKFCQKLIAADLDVSWMTMVRASTLEHIDAGLLRRSGCIEVQLGLESADPQVLTDMNKKATPQLYESVIRRALSAGINCTCYLIFGFPGETAESVRRTIAFMKQFDDVHAAGTVAWSFFPFILAPLSPIFEPAMRARHQIEGYMRKWRHATMHSSQAMQHVIEAFTSIGTSGSVYRSDNQDDLAQLTLQQRNDFQRQRHRLARRAMHTALTREEILHAFQSVL